mmetsp:Transcript_21831/g.32522  ORF Transcript_21831/g.32522 Transcript_21831/m.32522 type:complete len:906 (-) Transcript_21831:163-2880(-)
MKRAPLLASNFIVSPPSIGAKDPETTDGSTPQKTWSRLLNIVRINKPIELKTVPPSQRDVLCEIIASSNTLRELEIVHGSWIEIKTQATGKTCIGRIFAVDDGFRASSSDSKSTRAQYQHNVLYVPPSVCFNLGINSIQPLEVPLSVNRCVSIRRTAPQYSSSERSTDKSTSSTEIHEIPLAMTVQLARVASPNSSGYKSYTQTLQRFFSRSRVLRRGQVFGVPSTCTLYTDQNSWFYCPKVVNDPLLSEEKHSFDIHRGKTTSVPKIPLVFFKVANVAPQLKYFRVDPKSTTMMQEGVAQSRVPFGVEIFLHKSTLIPQIPRSLMEHHRYLTRLLLPHLHSSNSKSEVPTRILISGKRRSLKQVLVGSVARNLGLHVVDCNMYNILSGSERQTARNLLKYLREALKCKPAIVHLRRMEAVADHAQAHQQQESQLLAILLRDLLEQISYTSLGKNPLLIIASCEDSKQLPTKLQSLFTHQIKLKPPTADMRQKLIETSLQEGKCNVNAQTFASKTAGISAGDIRHVVGLAKFHHRLRIEDKKELGAKKHSKNENKIKENGYPKASDPVEVQLDLTDLESSLKEFHSRASSGAGLAKVPNVLWSDIGGLEHVKREILDTIQLPLQHRGLFSKGLKQRSGILLYGPPGTGKTLIAKAVATECSLNFISVKGPELLNMYIGESEKNVRDVFERARNAKPCVLFFDEMDSVAPKRGQGSDSGGVMDRVVSQLLTELDGMGDSTDVFVIGATNRPDLVDTALTRPGRLDRLVYLGVSSTREAQMKIVKALTRKFHLEGNVDFRKIVEKCSMNFTGADFYAMCSDAMLVALKRKIKSIDALVEAKKKRILPNAEAVTARALLDEMPTAELEVIVSMKDFDVARSRLLPSLSVEELAHYEKLQKQYELNKKR